MLRAKHLVFLMAMCMCQPHACTASDCENSALQSSSRDIGEERSVQVSIGGVQPSNTRLLVPPTTPSPGSVINEAVKIVTKIKNALPTADKSIVELFCGPLGYTLIGQKPVSFEEYTLDESMVLAFHKSFLQDKEFILHISSDGSSKKELCLIHKRSFVQLAQQERIIANFLYEKKVSAQSFLDGFEKSPYSFEEFCDHDPTVIGTLLGFGSQNALLWTRWAELGSFLRAWPFAHPCPIPSPLIITLPLPGPQSIEAIHTPKTNPNFTTLYAEWNWLNGRKKTISSLPVPSCIPIPSFLFWEGHEEQVRKFTHARELLAKVLLQAKVYK